MHSYTQQPEAFLAESIRCHTAHTQCMERDNIEHGNYAQQVYTIVSSAGAFGLHSACILSLLSLVKRVNGSYQPVKSLIDVCIAHLRAGCGSVAAAA